MPNPYRDEDRKNRRGRYDYDIGDIIQNALDLGSGIGSSVLGSVADALASVSAGKEDVKQTFAEYRRRLVASLGNPYGGWMTMGVFGWILCGSFGIAAFVMAVMFAVGSGGGAGIQPGDLSVFSILAQVFGFVTLGFGFMGWAGCRRANYIGRLRKYLRAARDYIAPVQSLAQGAMKPVKKVRADLRRAVADGHLPNACLDEAADTLYLDGSLYTPPAAPKAARPAAQPAGESKTETEAETMRREGVEFLRYLRGCTGKLDPSADEELAAMQKTCGVIMGFVHNHPEQLVRVRRFREYYIPTTRKLLDTAMGLGDTDAENAQAIRRDITGILHTLNIAYTKLYDTLLQDMSLDVSTEIDTLETMLRQDGLTHDFESDFGKRKA